MQARRHRIYAGLSGKASLLDARVCTTNGNIDVSFMEGGSALTIARPAGSQATLTPLEQEYNHNFKVNFGAGAKPKFIGGRSACPNLDAGMEAGYVLMKPGLIHNNHYLDSFTVIFKRVGESPPSLVCQP